MLIPSNRTKRECILSRLCFLVLSVWVFLPSAAQNNPYKIDDALYPIYQRASKQARQQEGLLVADTLYQQALKLGDKKAQCLAYIIPLQFYISQKDDSKIEKASTDLKEISRANNYLQYYYHAWSSEIIYCPTRIPANYTQALPNITVTPKKITPPHWTIAKKP